MLIIPRDPRFKIAGILTVLVVAVFLKMGFWQLERLQWKQGVLKAIEAEKLVDPHKVALRDLVDSTPNDLKRGFLTGVWAEGKNMKVGPELVDGKIGYWIVTPFMLNDGIAVLANRGWVPENMVGVMMDSAPPRGVVKITGTLRRSDEAGKMAGNDSNSWHGFNISGMMASAGVSNYARLGFFIDGSEPADDSVLTPAPVLSNVRNEHLNYAIFWFGMAILTLVIFVMATMMPPKPEQED